MIKIEMPKNVKRIISLLEGNGFEAFAVGGCVRDTVLGKQPNDWDITTSALPQDVKRIFHKTVDTGIQHGTVTVLLENTGYEVTTYRIDGEYEDGRHPKQVAFTGNLVEDLRRRDFTINAMAYNDSRGMVDVFGGISDLQNGIVRCVGNPLDRFGEDALRILRAVRFAAVLGFEIEDQTKAAAAGLAGNLQKISKERIQAELEKLVMSPHPELFETARQLGISAIVFDEIDRLYDLGKLSQVLTLVKGMPENHYLRWAALMVLSDGERVKVKLKELKFDNKTILTVSRLVDATRRPLPLTRQEVRKSIYEVGEDLYPLYLNMVEHLLLEGFWEGDSTEAVRIDQIYQDIIRKQECISIKGLCVNGRDLMEIGFVRGEQVGKALEFLLEQVMEDPSLNQKETLLELARKNA